MLPRLRHLSSQQKANALAAAIVAHLAAHGFIEGWHTHFRSTPAPAVTIAPQGHVAPTTAPQSSTLRSTVEGGSTTGGTLPIFAHGTFTRAHGARHGARQDADFLPGNRGQSGFKPASSEPTAAPVRFSKPPEVGS